MAQTLVFSGGTVDGQSFENPFATWPPPSVVSMMNEPYELTDVRDGVARYVPYSEQKATMRRAQRQRMEEDDCGCC